MSNKIDLKAKYIIDYKGGLHTSNNVKNEQLSRRTILDLYAP